MRSFLERKFDVQQANIMIDRVYQKIWKIIRLRLHLSTEWTATKKLEIIKNLVSLAYGPILEDTLVYFWDTVSSVY